MRTALPRETSILPGVPGGEASAPPSPWGPRAFHLQQPERAFPSSVLAMAQESSPLSAQYPPNPYASSSPPVVAPADAHAATGGADLHSVPSQGAMDDHRAADGLTGSTTEGRAAYVPFRDLPAAVSSPLAMQSGPEEVTVPAVPPDWVPDDKAVGCMRCAKHFTLIVRRHHCRMCGKIFCSDCCSNFSLLPRQFNRSDPQRVCVRCFEALLPMQRQLMLTVSKAARDGDFRQPPLNAPTTRSMRKEVAKAAATLTEFAGMPDSALPTKLLRQAKGVAFITMLKGGFIWAGKLGTGLVVARNEATGGWSAPSAIGAFGVSFGLQAGGELNSVILVLNNDAAVNAFCGAGHVTLGAGLSLAIGPWGRSVEADAGGGDAGAVACYSYCTAKGAFAGVAIEGTIVFCRADLNQIFYGRPVTSKQLLSGQIPPPRAAGPLYRALDAAGALM